MVRRGCRRYRTRLQSGAERSMVGDLALRRHLRGCAKCRAEFHQHRSIGRALRTLKTDRSLRPLLEISPSSKAKTWTKGWGPKSSAALALALVAGGMTAVGAKKRR